MNETDSNDEKKHTATKPNNTTDPAPIPCEKQQIVTNPSGNDRQNKKKKDWQAIFTGLIFLATTAYAIFAILQWQEMQKTSSATKQAAEAGAGAVKVAERNIKTTQDQFTLDQRAWINIEGANIREPFNPSKNIKIDFTTKNSGKTPALHVKYRFRTWIQYSGQKFGEVKKHISSEVTYGPGDEKLQTIYSDKPYPQQMINPLQSGQANLFIEIEFTYFDIYNEKNLRHTCACFYYNPIISPHGMSFCKTGCSYMD